VLQLSCSASFLPHCVQSDLIASARSVNNQKSAMVSNLAVCDLSIICRLTSLILNIMHHALFIQMLMRLQCRLSLALFLPALALPCLQIIASICLPSKAETPVAILSPAHPVCMTGCQHLAWSAQSLLTVRNVPSVLAQIVALFSVKLA